MILFKEAEEFSFDDEDTSLETSSPSIKPIRLTLSHIEKKMTGGFWGDTDVSPLSLVTTLWNSFDVTIQNSEFSRDDSITDEQGILDSLKSASAAKNKILDNFKEIVINYFSKILLENKVRDIRDFLAIIKNPSNKILSTLKKQYTYLSISSNENSSFNNSFPDGKLVQLIINLLKTDDNIRDNILKVDENEFTKRFIHTLKSYNKKVLETISQLKNKNKDSDNTDLDNIDPSKFSEFYSALVSLVSSYGFYYSLEGTPAGEFLDSVVETKIHYKPMTGSDPTSEYGVNVYFTVSFLMKIKEQVPDLMSAEVALHLFNRSSVISSRSFFSKGVDGKVSELRGSSVDDYINTLTVTPYSLHKVLPKVNVSMGEVNSRFNSEGITRILMPSILNFYGVDAIVSGISEVLLKPKQLLKKLLDVPYDIFSDKKLHKVIMQACIKGFTENREILTKLGIKVPTDGAKAGEYFPSMQQLIKNNISGNSSSTKLTDEEAKNINDLTAIAACYTVISIITDIIIVDTLPSLNSPRDFNEFVGALSSPNRQNSNVTKYLESFDQAQSRLKKLLKITSGRAVYTPSNVNFDIYGKSGLSNYFKYLTELSKKVNSKISDAMMKQLVREAKIDFTAIQNSLKGLEDPEALEEFNSDVSPLESPEGNELKSVLQAADSTKVDEDLIEKVTNVVIYVASNKSPEEVGVKALQNLNSDSLAELVSQFILKAFGENLPKYRSSIPVLEKLLAQVKTSRDGISTILITLILKLQEVANGKGKNRFNTIFLAKPIYDLFKDRLPEDVAFACDFQLIEICFAAKVTTAINGLSFIENIYKDLKLPTDDFEEAVKTAKERLKSIGQNIDPYRLINRIYKQVLSQSTNSRPNKSEPGEPQASNSPTLSPDAIRESEEYRRVGMAFVEYASKNTSPADGNIVDDKFIRDFIASTFPEQVQSPSDALTQFFKDLKENIYMVKSVKKMIAKKQVDSKASKG